MSFQFIDRIAVEDEGEGPVVVCVHGLGGSSNTYTPLMPALARHRVVRIDLPGSGRSQRAEGPLTIERYVATVLSVCERLGIQRAHWVGHSMGTIVCQHIAAAHPKCVASLALFGPLIAPPGIRATRAGTRRGARRVSNGRTSA
ncbi:alpha/beta fold hydrolase, partial [Variovorax sp. CT11-76]